MGCGMIILAERLQQPGGEVLRAALVDIARLGIESTLRKKGLYYYSLQPQFF